VTLFIQESAEQDIHRQVAWYAEKGLPDVARRFYTATLDAIDALLAMPGAGSLKPTSNPLLAGLRSCPIKGFDAFRIYYVLRDDVLIVVRVLHGKRDIGSILDSQDLD
jgi:toxin ParE1/3/4